jgi:hypothetical protein
LRRAIITLGLLSTSALAHAEDGKFTITGSARARVEALDGQPRTNLPDSEAALFLRTRIAARYDQGIFSIGGELVDSRAYFENHRTPVGPNEVDAFEPVQAYVALKTGTRSSIIAGRFVMNLGSTRLSADENFRNTTNGFTGVRFDWADKGGDKATAFWTMPQQHLADDAEAIRNAEFELDRERIGYQFYGATFTKAKVLGGTLEGYSYRLTEKDSRKVATRNRRLWTSGVRLFAKPAPRKLDYEIEAIMQEGKARATTAVTDVRDRDVSAWLGHAAIGKTLPGAWKPHLKFSADYVSGEGPGAGISRFDTLFGSRSWEFGPTGLYGTISRANLVSVEARIEVEPSKDWDGYLAVRPAWLENATDSFGVTGVRDSSGNSGRFAGVQIEGRARRWLIRDRLRLTAAAAYLAKGDFLKDAPNAPSTGNTRYGYVELMASF